MKIIQFQANLRRSFSFIPLHGVYCNLIQRFLHKQKIFCKVHNDTRIKEIADNGSDLDIKNYDNDNYDNCIVMVKINDNVYKM